ncbi:MAG TPA: DUF1499 domain-containing protein [Anaerolineales bacterium]|nr:DUF1499 domain-containing protein [Anaerolineales bacterium]
MLKIIGYILISLLLLMLAGTIVLYIQALTVGVPSNLGIQADGKLAACPSDARNCIASQSASHYGQAQPIPYTGSAESAQARLLEIAKTFPKVAIIREQEGYLHLVFRSKLMNFPDDVEFLIDDANKVIHFRSAARLGKGDLGVNPARMAEFRLQMGK